MGCFSRAPPRDVFFRYVVLTSYHIIIIIRIILQTVDIIPFPVQIFFVVFVYSDPPSQPPTALRYFDLNRYYEAARSMGSMCA